MSGFITHEGIAAPLPRDNLDTDVIIPMAPMMTTPRTELGPVAFEPLRYDEEGQERPDFVLNRPAFRDASVLIAGRNFGCGSSRERAVDALTGFGIRVVVAPSFGDIFFGNCIKNGLLPVRLDEAAHARVLQRAEAVAGEALFGADLPGQRLVVPGLGDVPFEIDAGHKRRLLDGRDEIELTLDHATEIDAWQAEDRRRRPWVWHLEREA